MNDIDITNGGGLMIGMVPIIVFQEFFMIRPKLKRHSVIIEDNCDYKTIKYYKNKFTLDTYFLDSKSNKKFYKDFADKIVLTDSVGKIFENINILNIEYDDDWKRILKYEVVDRLSMYYGLDKVKENLQQIIQLARNEFKSHSEYEDYDFSECIVISGDKIIKKYFEDIGNNIDNIYIVQSLLYPGFIELYYEMFSSIKKI